MGERERDRAGISRDGPYLSIKDANTPQGITEYTYDDNSNLFQILDANLNPTVYDFDGYDRLFTTTYADGSVYTFEYDKNSNLDKYTTPMTAPAVSIMYSYDALNRLRNKTFPATPVLDATYDYDLGSRLILADVDDANGAKNSFTYDNLNRLDTNTQILNALAPFVLDYDFDKVGNRTQVIYPSGKNVEYVYDEHDRMEDVKVNGVVMTHYTYDTLDRREIKDYLNIPVPQQTTYQFDIANQLSDVLNKITAGPNISQYQYPVYDNVGNRKQMMAPNGTHDYTYNDIYELTDVTGALTHDFDYDNVGNRLLADGVPYVPNILNQYDFVNGVPFSYDLNGNLSDDGNNTYGYDVQNRLTDMMNASHTASYDYDAFNRRVSKTVDGVTTLFLYDGDEIFAEYDITSGLQAEYVYGFRIDEILTMERGGQTYYYFYDGLGSVSEITNSAGVIVENFTYDPYGNILSPLSLIGNPYYFTGRRFDVESGIYYYRERMYDPIIGRFLERDPIGYYDSMNLYEYVGSNPINWIDPWGLQITVLNPGPQMITDGNGNAVIPPTKGGTPGTCPSQQKISSEGKSSIDEQMTELAILVAIAAIEPTPAGEGWIAGRIAGYTKHGIEQAIGREGRGVAVKAILDTIRNPVKMIKQSGGTIKYIGKKATVVINKFGEIVTTWGKPRF